MKMLLDLIEYVKFSRKMPIVCDEFEINNITGRMDLIGLSAYNEFHEFEIKKSSSDLRADLRKCKHNDTAPSYKEPMMKNWRGEFEKRFIPNYFSFVVPLGLISLAEKIVESINPNYGIIKYFRKRSDKYGSAYCKEWQHTSSCIVYRRAKRLVDIHPVEEINSITKLMAKVLSSKCLYQKQDIYNIYKKERTYVC